MIAMKKIIVLLAHILAVTGCLYAADPETDRRAADPEFSVAYFPSVVIVGQVTNINPKFIEIRNPRYGTPLTDGNLERLIARLGRSHDMLDKGFVKLLRTVTVTPDSHMQMTFYLDNVAQIFHDDANTYLQFLPLFYMFKSNLKELKVPGVVIEKMKKMSFEAFLDVPFIKKIMSDSWFVAVFQIHPETNKLVYQSSRFYENYEELLADDFAKEHQVAQIVERGMTTTVNMAVVTGSITPDGPENDIHQRYKNGGRSKGSPGTNGRGINAGTMSGGGN